MTTCEFNRELNNARSLLFSFALKLTKDYQNAQDLFQDAATRAFRYCERFESGTNFRAWMSVSSRVSNIKFTLLALTFPVVEMPIYPKNLCEL